jgi:hypothetical protein
MSHPERSRYSTAIENGLEASSRGVLPAFQVEVRYSDIQEMAGFVGAAARGAIEAGERDRGQPQADLAGAQGVEGGRGEGRGMGPCGFFQGEGGGRGGPPYAPESYGAGICGGSAVGRRATV